MEKVRFSIIIPCYNAENEVSRTIDSIQNQTFKNYEIIAINDYSTDNTKQVLLNYSNVKVIDNKENLKAGGSRNKGIEVANGEYIVFIDADDYLAENTTLQKLNDVIGEETPDIVYLGFRSIGALEGEWIPEEETSTLEKRARQWKYENVWDVCWNTKFIKENNLRFTEKRYFEDFCFYYRGIIRAKKYKVANFVTHIYTKFKDDSITSCVNEQKLQDLYFNVIELLEEIKSFDSDNKNDIIYAIYRVVEYSTRLLKEFEEVQKNK